MLYCTRINWDDVRDGLKSISLMLAVTSNMVFLLGQTAVQLIGRWVVFIWLSGISGCANQYALK